MYLPDLDCTEHFRNSLIMFYTVVAPRETINSTLRVLLFPNVIPNVI